jgi:tRNA pseudouridine38-40 synthase
MPCFRLVLEYDGSGFEGWQQQPEGHRTVQAVLAQTLQEFSTAPVRVRGAGRTDTGVHALGQVASVTLETRLDAEALRRALNARLPRDVSVHQVARVDADFDPRRHARRKCYRYAIWNGPARSPLRARTHHHVPQPLDRAALEQAAKALEGRHDFASFQAAGSSVTATVRTLFRVSVSGALGEALWLEFEGDGFLARGLTLVWVGYGEGPWGE